MLHNSYSLSRIACDFCDELAGGSTNGFVSRYGPFAKRLLVSDGTFCIVPSLGQIIEGHLLIIPVNHVCALADLPSDQLRAFDILYARVRSTLREVYDSCIFFEHGIRSEGAGGCGIDHAHMHAVPVAADGVLSVLEREFDGSRIESLEKVKDNLPAGSSYLFFEDVTSRRYLFPVNHLPSQYMRRLIAECIGKNNWDWRSFGCETELISTVQRLSPLFSQVASDSGS